MKKFPRILSYLALLLAPLLAGAGQIDFTVTGYTGTETLTDFPVLVRLSEALTGFDYAKLAPHGEDLSFFAADGRELAREVERWDPAGESLVWVRLPELAAGTTFRATYGTPGATSHPPSQTDGSVWTGAGYLGVWHMDSLEPVRDSTAFALHGTPAGGTPVLEEGAAGLAVRLDGATRISGEGLLSQEILQGFSIEAWRSKGSSGAFIGEEGCFSLRGTDSDATFTTPGVKDHNFGGLGSKCTRDWNQFYFTFNPGQQQGASFYVNGELTSAQQASTIKAPTGALFLGANQWNTQNQKGAIDELRVSKGIRSADWIKGCFETVASTSFLTAAVATFPGDRLEIVCVPGISLPAMVPANGVHTGIVAGAEVACSVPGGLLEVEDGVRATCTGWELARFDDGQERFVTTASGTGTSVPYRHPDPAVSSRLTWSFAVSNRVTVALSDGSLGSVDHPESWLPLDGTIRLEATPAPGASFYKWTGDVQGNDPTLPAITVKADRPLRLQASFISLGENTWHVAVDGAIENTGLTPADALPSIAAALEIAEDGDSILVGPGTYYANGTLFLTNAVTVTGAGIGETLLVSSYDGLENKRERLVHVDAKGALLQGMTLSGWGYGPETQSGEENNSGGVVQIGRKGGTVSRCRITGCTPSNWESEWGVGGAAALFSTEARLLGCVIDHNRASKGGGVFVRRGLVENCLIHSNRGAHGGGIYVVGMGPTNGVVRNCTIAGNYAEHAGGGLYFWIEGGVTTLQNLIIAGNETRRDLGPGDPEWSCRHDEARSYLEESLENCLFPDQRLAAGIAPVIGAPQFRDPAGDDFRLLGGSAAIDAAMALDLVEPTDVAGRPRLSGARLDIGCHEYDSESFSASFTAPSRELFKGQSVRLRLNVTGAAADDVACEWVLVNRRTERRIESTAKEPLLPLDEVGRYDITLTATAGAATSTLTRPDFLRVAARTNYFAVAGASSPSYPWETPETAGDDLQAIVDETIDGSVVILPEGTIPLAKQLHVRRGALLQGAGIGRTVFVPKGEQMRDRLVFLDARDAVLQDVTIRGTQLTTWGNRDDNLPGYGVLITHHGGTLRRCHVTGCANSYYSATLGAVAAEGPDALVDRCVIECNTNTACDAGGLYLNQGAVAENCLVRANFSKMCGGGFILAGENAVVRNCTFTENGVSGYYPSGAGMTYSSTRAARIVNCILAGNFAEVNEHSTNGAFSVGFPEWTTLNKETNSFDHCLFHGSIPTGLSAVEGDPLFRDVEALDFRLRKDSPAINAGLNGPWMEGALDLGGEKRIDGYRGIVDIGCFERREAPPGLHLILR